MNSFAIFVYFFASIQVLLTLEIGAKFGWRDFKLMQKRDDSFTKRLDAKTSEKYLLVNRVMSMLGHMPKPVVRKVVALYRRGAIKQMIRLLRAVSKLNKIYRLRRCKAAFSRQLCMNTSPLPFFMWAKMSANKIVRTPSLA